MIKVSSVFFSLCLTSAFPPAFGETVTWTVDNTHAFVIFKVSHLGFSHVYGNFPDLEGTITLDEAKPEAASIKLKIPTEKINTFNQKRDEHLRGPDFFNVKQHPEITLKSKSVKKKGENFDVVADLTLQGVTKPVNFTFHRLKTGKDPWGNTRTGGDATFKIKRSDFGLKYMSKPGEIGDEVEITVSLEAVRK